MYTDAVAVPTGYFRGVSAKRDRLSGVSLRRAKAESLLTQQSSRGMTFGRQPRCLPLSAMFAVAHAFRPSGHIFALHSVESWTRTKTAHRSGKELRGLLKSIIRLCLIVIGAPAAPLACEDAASRNISRGRQDYPSNPCEIGLTTPLTCQSIWNRFPAVWSWQPRG